MVNEADRIELCQYWLRCEGKHELVIQTPCPLVGPFGIFPSFLLTAFCSLPAGSLSDLPSSGLGIGITGRIPDGLKHFWAGACLIIFFTSLLINMSAED